MMRKSLLFLFAIVGERGGCLFVNLCIIHVDPDFAVEMRRVMDCLRSGRVSATPEIPIKVSIRDRKLSPSPVALGPSLKTYRYYQVHWDGTS